MSFMYNPYPFDDMVPVNRPAVSDEVGKQLVKGSVNVAKHLAAKLEHGMVIGIDGYTGADFDRMVNLLQQQLHVRGLKTVKADFRDVYKSEKELWDIVDSKLSWDRSEDPTLLFGRVYKGGYEGLLDSMKLGEFAESRRNADAVTIVYGQGCLIKGLRDLYDVKVYLDVTPKESILRIRR